MKLGFTSLDPGRGDHLMGLKTSFAKTQKPRAGQDLTWCERDDAQDDLAAAEADFSNGRYWARLRRRGLRPREQRRGSGLGLKISAPGVATPGISAARIVAETIT